MDRLGSGGVLGRLGFRVVGVNASYRYITQASCGLQLTKMLAARPAGRLQNSIHLVSIHQTPFSSQLVNWTCKNFLEIISRVHDLRRDYGHEPCREGYD